MALWLQNLIVFLAVGVCLAYVAWQGAGVFFGRRGRVGSCCAKGCPPAKPQAKAEERVVFLPVELLRRRR